MIFYGGPIITMNEKQMFVNAIGVRDEKIVAVGELDGVKEKMDGDFEVLDLQGNTLMPGFHDSHCHPIAYILTFVVLNLRDVKNYSDFNSRITEFIKNKNEGEWIIGVNFSEIEFDAKERHLPDRTLLDALSQNNPIIIIRYDGHIAIVNSKALEIARITKDTIPPEGSEYRKDSKGELAGIITEDAVKEFLSNYSFPSLAEMSKAAELAFDNYARLGITTLHGIYNLVKGKDEIGYSALEIPVIKSNQEKIHQNWYGLVNTKKPGEIISIQCPPLDGEQDDSKFKARALKLYIDGSFGASTAWMHEPFTDNLESSGFCVHENLEDLYELMKEAHELGLQICVHAIGDKGNRVIVDLYKRLLIEFPKENHRHRIEHASMCTSDVISDIKDLGLIASIQPSFITTDAPMLKYRIGEARCKYTYNIRSLIEAGIICASGSDCPVENPDVIKGLHVLVNRDGFVPEEAISIKEALKTYTINAAYAAFEENVKGSIEEGKLADLVILDRNPLEIPKEEIKRINVLRTIIRGRTVFQSVK